MRGVVIHAPKDLRIEELEEQILGPRDVRVRIEAGGICGSDLHYFHHGGTGAIRIRQPMVLGHEIAGTVTDVGGDVSRVTAGTRVAVNPSRPCRQCRYCQEGLHNHCLDMRFLGSAMRFPHVQGGFRETLVVDEAQAIAFGPSLSMSEAAMAEPLAVGMHAVNRAGPLLGRRILVTGCGPIGAVVILAARHAGAGDIVATDVQAFALAIAATAGADRTINIVEEPEALAALVRETGPFDVVFEASGNASAVRGALDQLRPRGILVQIGLGGDIPVPVNTVVTREIDIRGTFRFDAEFALAVDLMNRRHIDVRPLMSASMPFDQALDAFNLATDRSQAVKVHLTFA